MTYNPSAVGVFKVSFTFATFSPMTIGQLIPGNVMTRVVLRIDVPFSDPAATILVGTSTTPSLFLGATDSDPGVVDQYQNEQMYSFAVADFFQVTINPGASVAGSATLFYELK